MRGEVTPPPRRGRAGARLGAAEVRCACGSLLARVVGGKVELKCKRCKQVWEVPIEGA